MDQDSGDPLHPDNDITRYDQLRNNFCTMVASSGFDDIVNEPENLEVFLVGVVEESAPTNDVTEVEQDDAVMIGVGFRKASSRRSS